MKQPPPEPANRRALIEEVDAIDRRVRLGARATPPLSHPDRRVLSETRRKLAQQYFDLLPRVTLSRCPLCDTPLTGAFDPWGFDGFWWQETESGPCPPLTGCPHFRVLTGAVQLPTSPVIGGSHDAHLGGSAPYVIPAVLKHPTMTAVLHAIRMANGAIAFPIAYFSEKSPPTPVLAAPWTRTSVTFRTADGKPSFAYATDPWDFDLARYLSTHQLRWIDPDRAGDVLADVSLTKLPFATPPGPHARLLLSGGAVRKLPPPNGEKIEPFGD